MRLLFGLRRDTTAYPVRPVKVHEGRLGFPGARHLEKPGRSAAAQRDDRPAEPGSYGACNMAKPPLHRMEPSYGARPAVMAPCAGCGQVALAVKVDVSFHPSSLRAIGTQAEVLQPETIAVLIELPERPGHRRIGRNSVHMQTQLIG